MTKKKADPIWSKEWLELKNTTNLYNGEHWSSEWITLIHSKHLDEAFKYSTDSWLENKLSWFLTNGSTGILYLINYVWGDEGLDLFFEFIRWYIMNDSAPGHFHPSKAIKTGINEHRGEIKSTDLKKLTEMLEDFSEVFAVNDHDEGAPRWKPKEKD